MIAMKIKVLIPLLVIMLWLPCAPVFAEEQASIDTCCLTPLIDTPNNRIYWETAKETIEKATEEIQLMVATAEVYPDYPAGLQRKLYEALQGAQERGVKVKVILDTSSWSEHITETNRKSAEFLEDLGIRVRYDDPEVTTHSKVLIVDGDTLLLGSSNWNYPTYAETYQVNIKVQCPQVTSTYSQLFETLWKGGRVEFSHNASLPPDEEKTVLVPLISTGEIRQYYQTVKSLIAEAEESLYVIMYRMGYYPNFEEGESNELLQKLIDAGRRGVAVKVILEKSDWSESVNELNEKTAWWLTMHNIPVRFDDPSVDTHMKIVVADGESVILGSTNWSYYSLVKNNETDLLIHNQPQLARVFESFFKKYWKNCQPVQD